MSVLLPNNEVLAGRILRRHVRSTGRGCSSMGEARPACGQIGPVDRFECRTPGA